MKTVKLKIRKGISLLYAGIFVYTFPLALPEGLPTSAFWTADLNAGK